MTRQRKILKNSTGLLNPTNGKISALYHIAMVKVVEERKKDKAYTSSKDKQKKENQYFSL